MKIIFSEQFLLELQQLEQVIKLTNYSIAITPDDNMTGEDLLRVPVDDDLKNLYSIWDNERKQLSLSISLEDNENENIEKIEKAFIRILYTNSDNILKIAFVLVGNAEKTNNSFSITELDLCAFKNLINIDFSKISVASIIETNLTENIKILESSLDQGNNIFLISPDSEYTTITKDSFIKFLYRTRCESSSELLQQDYLMSNTGEKVYRNTIHRVYNTEAFYPRLTGDILIIKPENDSINKTTTTKAPTLVTTTTRQPSLIVPTEFPEINIKSLNLTSSVGNTCDFTTTLPIVPDLGLCDNAETTTKKPYEELVCDSTTISPTVPDLGLCDEAETTTKKPYEELVCDSTTTQPIVPGPGLCDEAETTTTTSEEPEKDSIEYGTFGLSYLGGTINVVGLVGYTDYILTNNKVSKINNKQYYQNINELSNIIITKQPLVDKKTNKTYPEINLDISGKTISYRESNKPEVVRGNRITITIPTLDLEGNVITCKKEFTLKQSNDYDNPWELRMPSNVEIGYEYESIRTGLILKPTPVIIFNEKGKTLDDRSDCIIEIITTDETVHNSFLTETFKINYGFVNGYNNSYATNGISYHTEPAETVFNRFFKISYIDSVDEGKLFIHRFLVTNNTDKNKDIFIYPDNFWVPYSNHTEPGNHKQLLIKCNISLEFDKGVEILKGSNKFTSSFYVVQRPNYRKDINVYDGSSDLSKPLAEWTPLTKIVLNESNGYSKNVRLSCPINRPMAIDDVDNAWVSVNPDLNQSISIKELDNEVDSGYFTLDTSTFSKEYSNILTISSLGNSFDLKEITFNYVDCYLYGKDFTQNIINNFDYTDWKSYILLPKVTVPIEKTKYLNYSFDGIVLENGAFSKKRVTDGYLGVAEVGVIPITLDSNCNIKVTFKSSDNNIDKLWLGGVGIDGSVTTNPDTNITTIYLNILDSELEGSDINGYFQIGSIEISTYTIDNSEEIKKSIPIYSFLEGKNEFPYSESMIKNGLIRRTELVDINSGILNSIFLSGYSYKPDTSDSSKGSEIAESNTDKISIGFKIPINPSILGTSAYTDKNSDNYLEFLNTNENISYEDKIYTVLGSSYINIANSSYENHNTTFECESSRSSGNSSQYYRKYPTTKLGDILVTSLGTSVFGCPIECGLYKKGIKPDLFNSYNLGKLPNNTEINVTCNIGENITNVNFSFDVRSIYPLTEQTFSTKAVGSVTSLKDSKITVIDSEPEKTEYLRYSTKRYTINADLDLKIPVKLESFGSREKVASLNLRHFLNKDFLFNRDEKPSNFEEYDNDIIKDLIGVFDTDIDVYCIGTAFQSFKGDTSVVNMYGETRTYSISKPNEVSTWLEQGDIKVNNTFPEENKTLNNSVIDFDITYPEFTTAIQELNNCAEPINLNNSESVNLVNKLTDTRQIQYKILIDDYFKVSGAYLKTYDIAVKQSGVEDGVFYRDSEDCFVFVKDTGVISKKVPHNTTSIKFNALQINLSDLRGFDINSYALKGKTIKIIPRYEDTDIDYEIFNTDTVDNYNAYNVIVNISPNFSKNEITNEFYILGDNNIKFKFIVTQEAYFPDIYINNIDINSLDSTNNCILGFHSSGNLLDNDSENDFGYLNIRANTSDIYNQETGQINFSSNSDLGLEHFVTNITVDEFEYFNYRVAISIKPNYLREEKTGEIILSDKNSRSWTIRFKQGYLTSNLLPNGSYENDTVDGYGLTAVDKELTGYSTLGVVGTEEEPIQYPATDVRFEPYYYVQILQKEIIYDKNGLVDFGEETLISNSNNTIPKTLKSLSQDPYTVVTYQAEPWTTSVNNGLNLVFKPGTYDTDLLYRQNASIFPRLIHRYEVSEDFGSNELVFNVITRLSINRYKKYLYKIADDTNNIVTEVQSPETTPFIYSFWLKKSKSENNIPINLIDENGEAVTRIDLNGYIDETRKIYATSNVVGFNLKDDVEITSSDYWLSYELFPSKTNEQIVISAKLNTTGKTRNGVITFIPYDTLTWSGIKSIDVYQNSPSISINLPSKTIRKPYYGSETLVNRKISIPIFINEKTGTSIINRSYTVDSDWVYTEGGNVITTIENNQEIWLFEIKSNESTKSRNCYLTITITYSTIDSNLETYTDTVIISQDGKSSSDSTSTETPEISTSSTTTTTTLLPTIN